MAPKWGGDKINELDIQGVGMTSQRTRDRLIDRLQDKGIVNSDVLRVMRLVPRHLFVDEAMASRSYEDASFPIGHGQTISQPFIVARMTELIMQSESLENVLEVGTGSGYQAAVLGGLVKNLHTVEVVTELHRNARDLLYKLGYRNIRTHLGDGSWGWEEAAPYDAIMVTAAPDEIPSALIQQLKIGGRMIIPVGAQNSEQKLQVVTRNNETNYSVENHESVIFVPLVGG
ncbi:protein-L-isoaspartate(D-aspartate) O-methyltransferase [Cocleimonas flava]|uniref:Protein-L-isoaspartate O-methyltransferase n=1 Tax=Cocleimonas flava TaxID=634765 RepID=A0A4R1ESP1_9GAMM|nr:MULTISPECIES: protein-L-isoaspartate(D-aspartate) O-methyltransferase [Cocleimonas]MEB8432499.1 protein-L-isoaspartate(D-aspartate) O-methyltransferase [Cocleimonas sp. KMM 6892]MEC4715358.1 protein-L-isoaspartate(D-aspartate) O-methyltransferase [Cocleimonas sp. KMM 6895]TCJ82932.1 protein-L-isoaspartate(D-aspartate) O-methyltransferase [Cocleimonas flava]